MKSLAIRVMGFLVVLALSLTTSCAGSYNYIDPELYPYVKEFEDTYGVEIEFDVYLTTEELGSKPSVLGTCSRTASGPVVEIELSFWESALEGRRKTAVFHELGHCAFDLRHNNKEIEVRTYTQAEGVWITEIGPYSIMHYKLFPNRFYKKQALDNRLIPQMFEEIASQEPLKDERDFECEGF